MQRKIAVGAFNTANLEGLEAILGAAEELGLPVKWIGVGEGIMDFRPFEPDKFVEALFDSGK